MVTQDVSELPPTDAPNLHLHREQVPQRNPKTS